MFTNTQHVLHRSVICHVIQATIAVNGDDVIMDAVLCGIQPRIQRIKSMNHHRIQHPIQLIKIIIRHRIQLLGNIQLFLHQSVICHATREMIAVNGDDVIMVAVLCGIQHRTQHIQCMNHRRAHPRTIIHHRLDQLIQIMNHH